MAVEIVLLNSRGERCVVAVIDIVAVVTDGCGCTCLAHGDGYSLDVFCALVSADVVTLWLAFMDSFADHGQLVVAGVARVGVFSCSSIMMAEFT